MKLHPSITLISLLSLSLASCKKAEENTGADSNVEKAVEQSGKESKETVEKVKATAKASKSPEEVIESSIKLQEEFVGLFETIKDEASAKEAMSKFEGLGEKVGALTKKSNMLIGELPADKQEELTKMMMDKSQAVQQRMQTAMPKAMQVLATNPELMKEFQEKMKLYTEKASGQ